MRPNYKRKERRGPDRRLFAPASGRQKPLSAAADPWFASRLFGEGIALELEDDVIVAPCSAVVTMVPFTRQSIGLENEQGDMILIHVGTQASQYGGRGFETLASEGTKVRVGTPLIRLDRQFLEGQKADLTVCMVITNQNKGVYRIVENDVLQGGKTMVMERK